MRSKKVLIVLAVLTMVLTFVNSVLMVCDAFLYSIDDVPQGTLLRMETKNMGNEEERTISVYKVENSLGKGILCTVKTPNSPERNVFWQVGADDVTIRWTAVDRAVFMTEGNEDISINIDNDSYDCRVVVEESIPVVDKVKS